MTVGADLGPDVADDEHPAANSSRGTLAVARKRLTSPRHPTAIHLPSHCPLSRRHPPETPTQTDAPNHRAPEGPAAATSTASTPRASRPEVRPRQRPPAPKQ